MRLNYVLHLLYFVQIYPLLSLFISYIFIL
jgi:hypothetical protein